MMADVVPLLLITVLVLTILVLAQTFAVLKLLKMWLKVRLTFNLKKFLKESMT
jgi:hypothetical protein